MKTLKSLVVASALTLTSPLFSQVSGVPALVEMDAKRKNISADSNTRSDDSSNYYVGEKSLDGELSNYIEGRQLSIFYRNDESVLNRNDSLDMKTYFENLSDDKIHYFQIRGFADINGETKYNYDLGLKRAKVVANKIKQNYPDVPIEIISVGESGSHKNLEKNRKVEVIPNEPSFYTDLQASDASYFLLDLSGSMNEYLRGTKVPKYYFLREVEFPLDARIFGFFSGEIPKGDGLLHLDHFVPKGSSEIYGSTTDLVDKLIDEGEKLHIFTDGVSTDKNYTIDNVIDSAIKKNVEISVIGVDIPVWAVPNFRHIASKTGGNYSVHEKK